MDLNLQKCTISLKRIVLLGLELEGTSRVAGRRQGRLRHQDSYQAPSLTSRRWTSFSSTELSFHLAKPFLVPEQISPSTERYLLPSRAMFLVSRSRSVPQVQSAGYTLANQPLREPFLCVTHNISGLFHRSVRARYVDSNSSTQLSLSRKLPKYL
jgi:hypothetical protein